MRLSRIVALFAAGALLAGCAYNDHFDNRVARFDVAAAQSRDTMILANIIRASHGEPLSFFQLGKITGTNTAQAQAGLPPLIFGPHVSHVANAATSELQSETIFGASPGGGAGFVGNSAAISGSTNFEVNPQESKEFYRGLLSEVEPRTLEFFIHQGVSRELLFYLFTEKIIVTKGGKTEELRNDPLADPEKFGRFQYYVAGAMNYGLRSEELLSGKKSGGGKVGDKSPGKSGEAAGDKSTPPSESFRLCFDPLLKNTNLPWASNAPICGLKARPPAPGAERTVRFTERGVPVTLTVLPRSAFAIFQFLGRIVAAGEKGQIHLRSAEAIDSAGLRDESLFSLSPGASEPGGCYLTAEDGDMTWCVPKVGATNTKRILGLLAQLLALNTSIADIPITPTVRLLQ